MSRQAQSEIEHLERRVRTLKQRAEVAEAKRDRYRGALRGLTEFLEAEDYAISPAALRDLFAQRYVA